MFLLLVLDYVCLGAHVPKTYGSQFVYLCICVNVCNSDFLRWLKTTGKCSTGTARQYLKLNIVLDFFNIGFFHYLWCDLVTSNAIVVQLTNLFATDLLGT